MNQRMIQITDVHFSDKVHRIFNEQKPFIDSEFWNLL